MRRGLAAGIAAAGAAGVLGGMAIAGFGVQATAPPGTKVVAVAPPSTCVNGAKEIGDTYYPGIGNGGYDVTHYDLNVKYDVHTRLLDGKARITAAATQNLCRFNIDLRGLTVTSVKVNDAPATFTRDGRELIDHAGRGAQRGDGLPGRDRLQRRAGPGAARPRRLPRRLELHRERRLHVDAAAGRRHLVPEQQHAQRQGVVPLHRDHQRRPPGDVQRRARSPTRSTRPRAPRPGSGTRPTRWRPTWRRCRSASTRSSARPPRPGSRSSTASGPTS